MATFLHQQRVYKSLFRGQPTISAFERSQLHTHLKYSATLLVVGVCVLMGMVGRRIGAQGSAQQMR